MYHKNVYEKPASKKLLLLSWAYDNFGTNIKLLSFSSLSTENYVLFETISKKCNRIHLKLCEEELGSINSDHGSTYWYILDFYGRRIFFHSF